MRFSRLKIGGLAWVPSREVPKESLLYKKCIVRSRFSREPIILGRRVKGWFGFPRFLISSMGIKADNIEDLRVLGMPLEATLTAKLWPEQQVAFSTFEYKLNAGFTGFFIEAATGWGKTVALIACILRINRTALIVVPKSDLLKQWRNRFLEHSDLKEEDIGYVQGRKADWEGKKVVIALIDSLGLNYLPREFKRMFGQVWYDEVHTTVPPQTFRPVVTLFPSYYRGGTTATPDRADGLEKVFYYHLVESMIFGGSGNRMLPVVLMLEYPRISCYIPDGLSRLEARGFLISALARNQHRNRVLLDVINSIYLSDRRSVVISDRTVQLQTLRKNLHLVNIPRPMARYYADSLAKPKSKKKRKITEEEQEHALNKADIVLSTYGMMKLGTDSKSLSALIFATPQSDVRQPSGRIQRLLDGKKQPVIVDLIDTAHEEAIRWAEMRIKTYQKDGLYVKTITLEEFYNGKS